MFCCAVVGLDNFHFIYTMNVFQLASSVLNNLDSAAKDVLEEPKVSATALRAKRKTETNSNPGVLESLPTSSKLLVGLTVII